jgi:hypothetical protein
MRGPIAAGTIAFVAILAVNGMHATPYNNYVLLADAFWHGRVWIDWPGPSSDALSWAGRYYVIEAPLPAVLLLPVVAIWGTAANQTLLAALLAAIGVGAGWEIARRLEVPLATRAWLCGFLLLGTDLFWTAMYGDVWFIAHVSAVAFTLLALVELLGRKRAWLVALFAVCAIESRFSLILALPVYAALLALDVPDTERRKRLFVFVATLVPFVLLWVAYNQARWGLPYDVGYTAWYHQDSAGKPTGSPFRLSYVPNQLYSFFVRFPNWIGHAPYFVPTYNGVALTWTSPALLLAAFAREPRRLVIAMWAAAALVALPNLLYYVNGYVQFGMRHALDFEAFLFVLMALAMRRGIGPLGAVLCAWSMVAGTWGIWFWKTFYRSH